MERRASCYLFLCIFGAVLASLSACRDSGSALSSRESVDSSLKVAISIPPSRGARTLHYVKGRHFHVTLTNTSSHEIQLWREWCSWGYFALSFEVEDSDGKKWTIKRADRGWDKNYPDYFTLPPGESFPLDVELNDGTWENLSVFEAPGPGFIRVPGYEDFPTDKMKNIRMRAIYEVRGDSDSRENDVWTGSVVSPWDDYILSVE